MHAKMLRTLEFDKMIQLLSSHASSAIAEEFSKKLIPSTNLEEVEKRLVETDEAVRVLRVRGNVPLSGIYAIKHHVKRAEIGGMLNPMELRQIASTLAVSKNLRSFVEGLVENEVDIPILEEQVNTLPILTSLEHTIKDAIDEAGDVLDSASDALRTIRQQIRQNESKIREKLDSYVRSSNASKMLSDAIVTIRNDRYVIPVKQEYRSHFGGIVHDQSSSGQTLFVEPQAVVQLNNQLREVRARESVEIERILMELSNEVALVGPEVMLVQDIVGHIDFVFSKGKLAHVMKASLPKVNQEGKINLKRAKHPLLDQDTAVANDIYLGNPHSSMVITGPNTGGKTVTLKTVGLCTLMAQAGLFVPALDGSEVAIFEQVFADIGDEQSIEQSLSTFSSHMVNIVEIMKQVNDRSLVLFDELGAGTDPQEGAALAISILDEVYNAGATVIATTHYPELKAYGYNREGVVNASVEFDVNTLSPTYRLLIGVPGRSNAFEISKRLGLPDSLIERAKGMVGTDRHEVENMIASLEENRLRAEKEADDAHDLLTDAQKFYDDMQKQMMEYYEYKDQLFEKAKVKAAKVVEKAQEEAEEIMSDLRFLKQHRLTDVKEHELIDIRKRLEEATPKKPEKQQVEAKKTNRVLREGDEVKVLSFGQKGILLEKVSEKEWNVQIGIMKMKVEEKQLEFIKGEKKAEPKPLATVKGKDFHVSLELDLRGERYESALMRVEKYIDDAVLAGYPRVSVIHGKGTGALRTGVQEYLRNHRSVKKIRFGEATEGGTGVTIVELK